MTKNIYQLQIELLRSKPGIWRRILIPSGLLLSDLHKVLQTSMGWTNSHLHQFIKDRRFYTEKDPDNDLWGELNNIDYKGMTISDFLKKENDDIIYEYDFGDGWEHQIVLEKVLPAEENIFYPVCIGGRMNCPPEDCGGISGYLEMLKILKQPKHEEYDGYITWLGGEFDPLNFDINAANQLLQKKNFGLPDPLEIDLNQGSPSDFEGYSPAEMHNIIYFSFEETSLVKFQEPGEEEYKKIPIFNQIKYITGLMRNRGEIKLTKKGFLPVKVVADIYRQGFMKDEYIESGIVKLYKEKDSITIHLPRILLEISGLCKKRNNKLSLTKKGETIIKDDFKLLNLIIQTFTTKFNWAYFDGYGENKIGQVGHEFSLILLDKYGEESREDTFYAKKYFKAFPMLAFSPFDPGGQYLDRMSGNCYSLRTFDRFLELFGLIEKIKERGWDKPTFIKKTDLFNKLFRILPPGSLP